MKRSPLHTALERLNQYIQTHGMRPSPVRETVLKEAYALPQPFTADQLVKVCAAQRISTGTVYNALNLFVSAQILHSTTRQRGKAATEYEWIAGSPLRMQVICEKCGRVSDFHDKAIERLIRERRYSNFNLQHFSLFAYGECKICRGRNTKKDN